MPTAPSPVALVTGASAGLGRALASALAERGWRLLLNARRPSPLREVQRELAALTTVEAVSGDVRDEILLLQLAERLDAFGWRPGLVVNNASLLGPSPRPPLLEAPAEALHAVYHANAIAPLSLLAKLADRLADDPVIVNVSSDAAAEAYPGWGVYGAAKAALDHASRVLALERPDWRVYAFDPGDMRTAMHRAAFPGEDISDRPLPGEIAVPALLHLLDTAAPSGRYVASEVISPAPLAH